MIHSHQRLGSREPFHDRLERDEERVIKRGIDADLIASIVGVAPDEARDVLLGPAVQDLAEGEEVLLADAQGELAGRVAKGLGQIALEVPERVDPENPSISNRAMTYS